MDNLIGDLSNELLEHMFDYNDYYDIYNLKYVSKEFYIMINNFQYKHIILMNANKINKLQLHFTNVHVKNISPENVYNLSKYICITKYTFVKEFNCELNKDMFPPNLTHIYFNCYNYIIKKNTLPSSLTHIIFYPECDNKNDYEYVLEKGSFPESLTHLCFKNGYEKIIPGILPKNLTHLCLGQDFNVQLNKNQLPHNLRWLSMPGYNKKILDDVLPKSIEYLELGVYFNNDISKNNLPESLKVLSFSSSIGSHDSFNFKKVLKRCELPEHLETIIVDEKLYDVNVECEFNELNELFKYNETVLELNPESGENMNIYSYIEPENADVDSEEYKNVYNMLYNDIDNNDFEKHKHIKQRYNLSNTWIYYNDYTGCDEKTHYKQFTKYSDNLKSSIIFNNSDSSDNSSSSDSSDSSESSDDSDSDID